MSTWKPRLDARTYVVVLAQLLLLSAAIHLLEIERAGGLPRIIALVAGGFAVHAWLPRRAQAPLFLALSAAAAAIVLGGDALWLGGLGLILVGICRLPLTLAARGLLLAVAGAVLATVRAGEWQTSWSSAVVPVLASMFMFRVVLYLLDHDRGDGSVSIWRQLSYFFMLPNVCFPLFPIVDYSTFNRTYFARPAEEIYARGIHWMARGLLHLLAYRVVYHLLLPAPWDVTDASSMLRFIVATYALYLRISGQFHLIVGVLCLFGFDLPETHKRYFLASSFLDYWRRVNIYWKDFVEKVVFYPVFLRVRRSGAPQPLVLAVLLTFAVTWLLHSYQWFWLRGRFPITVTDAIFWGVLGVAVAANSVWESRRRRAAPAEGFSPGGALARSAQTLAMFAFLAVLWSLWSADSLSEWVRHMGLLGEGAGRGAAALLAFVALALGGGTAAQWVGARPAARTLGRFLDPSRSAAVSLATCTALLGLGVLPRFWAPTPGGRLATGLAAVTEEKLNEQDATAQVRGYYENLLAKNNLLGELWRSEVEMPPDWVSVPDSEFSHNVGTQIAYELYPSMSGTLKRVAFSTNRFGMRDQEYELEKPPRTYRIALLGSSYSMGSGVADGEPYEAVAEERLNREFAGPDRRFDRYEILNFAVGGYTHAHQCAVYQEKVRQFHPDAVFLADHTTEGQRVIHHFALRPVLMLTYPNPNVRRIADKAGIYRGMDPAMAEEALFPYKGKLTLYLFEQLAAAVRSDGARVAWLYVPLTRDDMPNREVIRPMRQDMADMNQMIILSLEHAYGELRQAELSVAPWDEHPNVEAHRRLADELIREMLKADGQLGTGLTR